MGSLVCEDIEHGAEYNIINSLEKERSFLIRLVSVFDSLNHKGFYIN